ncbi:hypothetical protein [Streptomyces caatingaensis]
MRLLENRHQGTAEDLESIDDIAMIFGYRYASAAVLGGAPATDTPVVDPRTAGGRPGLRAPHVWLDRSGTRLSTLDLFTDGFTLLAGRDGTEWTEAAAAATSLGVKVTAHRVGGELQDHDDAFAAAYGIGAAGAVLVRPDGFVAWRAEDRSPEPGRELERALARILARP